MKSSRLAIAVLSIVMVTLACGFNASTAKIKDAWTARDEAGEDRTTVFGQSDTFYVKVDLANAPDDTTVKASFTVVDAEGEEANTFLDDYEITSGSNMLTFNLSNNQLWPVGKYKVELFLNSELERTIEFEVR